MSVYIPPQCSEDEGGDEEEDCVWASGVMLNNAAHGAAVVPSTRKEYEALRVAGGDGPAEKPGDGSNLEQLQTGIEKRYHWSPLRVGPPGFPHPKFANAWGLLTPGTAAAIQGSMGVFDRAGHWRRWDRQFGGAHCTLVVRVDALDRVWWMNPSAPNTYAGEWMTKADLEKYFNGFGGGLATVAVGRFATPPTDTEELVNVYSVPGKVSAVWPAGAPIYPGPTGKKSGDLSSARRLEICGQDKPTKPARYLCDGAEDGPSAQMRWLDVTGATERRDESYNAGVNAAQTAAGKARR